MWDGCIQLDKELVELLVIMFKPVDGGRSQECEETATQIESLRGPNLHPNVRV